MFSFNLYVVILATSFRGVQNLPKLRKIPNRFGFWTPFVARMTDPRLLPQSLFFLKHAFGDEETVFGLGGVAQGF